MTNAIISKTETTATITSFVFIGNTTEAELKAVWSIIQACQFLAKLGNGCYIKNGYVILKQGRKGNTVEVAKRIKEKLATLRAGR